MLNIKYFSQYLFMYFWTNLTLIIFFFKKNNLNIKYKIKNIKVAVVKPYFYLDLYNIKNYRVAKDIIYSSQYRLGPSGLFYNMNADYFISDLEPINNLKKKINNRIKNNIGARNLMESQKKKISRVGRINFNQYDLVVCYEGGISEAIIKKFSTPIWALLLEDHSHENYKKFLLKRPKPFDVFFNNTQGFTPYSLFRANHSIDFSHTFGNSDLKKKLNIVNKKEIDVLIEVHQPSFVEKQASSYFSNYNISKLNGGLKISKYLNILSKSKFFFCPIFTSPRWGNSIIEAALFQCLLVGNKMSFWNSILIHKDLHCTNVTKGLKIISKLYKNKKEYYFYLKHQNIMLTKINYLQPLFQLQQLKKNNKKINFISA
jgi:hypothetical protein